MKNIKYYQYYLTFVFVACSGAIIWQLFIPQIALSGTSWGVALGWQKEIALWNVALVSAIIYSFIKKEKSYYKILTIQSTILFIVLGLNHTWSFFENLPNIFFIHLAGIFEILLLGGGWGIYALVKSKD